MISIVNMEVGNLRSITNALDYLQVRYEIVDTPKAISQAKKLMLPGVGAFYQAMNTLKAIRAIDILNKRVLEDKVPVLGVCVGMQIMASQGYEGQLCQGLNWINGEITPIFKDRPAPPYALSHVGFNQVKIQSNIEGFDLSLVNDKHFYFCHRYALQGISPEIPHATVQYAKPIIACFQHGNIWGAQFHPEKSQSNGLTFLKKFSEF